MRFINAVRNSLVTFGVIHLLYLGLYALVTGKYQVLNPVVILDLHYSWPWMYTSPAIFVFSGVVAFIIFFFYYKKT